MNDGRISNSAAFEPVVFVDTTAWNVLKKMGADDLKIGWDEHPERYMARPGVSFPVRNPEVSEPRIIANEASRPRLVDTFPAAGHGIGTEVRNERLPAYLFRAISEEDYLQMRGSGFMQSDGRMNLTDEGTVAAFSDPTFYLPGKLASNKPGDYPARVIRIRYSDDDDWRLDKIDGYAKTHARVPFSRIDAVSPRIIVRRDLNGRTETVIDPDELAPLELADRSFEVRPHADESRELILDELIAEDFGGRARLYTRDIPTAVLGAVRDFGYRIRFVPDDDKFLAEDEDGAKLPAIRELRVRQSGAHALVHELGHAVDDMAMRFGPDGSNALIEEAFTKSRSSGELESLDLYARTKDKAPEYFDRSEFFAESFATYYGGVVSARWAAKNRELTDGEPNPEPFLVKRDQMGDHAKAAVEHAVYACDRIYHELHQRFSIHEESNLITTPGAFYAKPRWAPHMAVKLMREFLPTEVAVTAHDVAKFPELSGTDQVRIGANLADLTQVEPPIDVDFHEVTAGPSLLGRLRRGLSSALG